MHQTTCKIIDAQTQNKITVYIIQYRDIELRKRYSEFDQLHDYLKDKYPAIIIPSIPSKTSLKQYAAHPNSAKFDPNVIQQRKRLLEKFLSRVLEHQILSEDDGVLQFLNPSAAPVLEVKGTHKKRKSFSIVGQTIKNPDLKFIEYENYIVKLNSHYKLLEKLQKKVFRKYSDMAPDDAELGAVYNALALTEHAPELQQTLQGLGQAVDKVHVAKLHLCNEMQVNVQEPLHEYSLITEEIKEMLDFRTQEQISFEQNTDSLASKWTSLKQLEKTEEESKKMADAYQNMERQRPVVANKGVIGNITEKINSMMDSDPDATRRHNIAKTKDTIAQVIFINIA